VLLRVSNIMVLLDGTRYRTVLARTSNPINVPVKLPVFT